MRGPSRSPSVSLSTDAETLERLVTAMADAARAASVYEAG